MEKAEIEKKINEMNDDELLDLVEYLLKESPAFKKHIIGELHL